MERISNGVRGDAQVSHYWHADRPSWTAPKLSGKTKNISKTVVDEGVTTVIKVLYYIGENGKLYDAKLFDQMFKPKKGKVKPNKKRDEDGNILLNQF